jgi:error-prone DNA polymerase
LLRELPEQDETSSLTKSPLAQMTIDERLAADFQGTGVTVGPHPMAYHRDALARMGIVCSRDLQKLKDGRKTRIAGCVIARQRPGTAKGFVFLSLEDETGISNAIVTPTIYEQFRRIVTYGKFLLIEGKLQNQENVISVKADVVRPLEMSGIDVRSHDFH